MNFDRYNIRLSFLFFVICLAIVSCKKEKEDPYQNHMLAQETFDYGYFKVGTYWIYKDSITGAEDCVYVFYNYTQIDTIPENNSYEYDPGLYNWFDVKCHSTFYNKDYQYWCNSSYSNEYNGYLFNINRAIFNGSSTVYWNNSKEIGKQFYPLGGNSSIVTLVGIYNSFAGCENVYLFNETKNATEELNETDFFIAKNIGTVKKVIYNKHSWHLIRNKIFQ